METLEYKIIDNFISKKDCQHIINLSKSLLFRSQTIGEQYGKRKGANNGDYYRNSYTAYISMREDPVIRSLKQKISELTQRPRERQEPLNVTHYKTFQHYLAHYDTLNPKDYGPNELMSGPRELTIIVYLNSNFFGGNTVFPRINLKVKPKTGRALLFHNLTAEGRINPLSIHIGQGIVLGKKWILNQWIRTKAVPNFDF